MPQAAEADTLVVFNRLFDAEQGVAYGGWDLSDRNLRVLDLHRRTVQPSNRPRPSMCGTGNVTCGRMVLEYAQRGCESVQIHTLFQLPQDAYPATAGSRAQRVLHLLVFDPKDGLLAAMMDGGHSRFLDLAEHAHRPR